MCRSEIADTLDLTQADIETLQDMLANSQVHLNFDAIKEVRCIRVLFKILSAVRYVFGLSGEVNTKFTVVCCVQLCMPELPLSLPSELVCICNHLFFYL